MRRRLNFVILVTIFLFSKLGLTSSNAPAPTDVEQCHSLTDLINVNITCSTQTSDCQLISPSYPPCLPGCQGQLYPTNLTTFTCRTLHIHDSTYSTWYETILPAVDDLSFCSDQANPNVNEPNPCNQINEHLRDFRLMITGTTNANNTSSCKYLVTGISTNGSVIHAPVYLNYDWCAEMIVEIPVGGFHLVLEDGAAEAHEKAPSTEIAIIAGALSLCLFLLVLVLLALLLSRRRRRKRRDDDERASDSSESESNSESDSEDDVEMQLAEVDDCYDEKECADLRQKLQLRYEALCAEGKLDDPCAIEILTAISKLCTRENNYEEKRRVKELIYASRCRTLAETPQLDQTKVKIQKSIAKTYEDQANHAEARKIYQRIHELQSSSDAFSMQDRLVTQEDIAYTYYYETDYQTAREQFQSIHAHYCEHLAESSDEALCMLEYIAKTYRAQEDYKRAAETISLLYDTYARTLAPSKRKLRKWEYKIFKLEKQLVKQNEKNAS